MADIASDGNSQLQLKGAAQLAKGLRQAGADLKDLRDINEQAAQIVAPAAKALARNARAVSRNRYARVPHRRPVWCAPATTAR